MSLLLCAVMLFTVLPLGALAEGMENSEMQEAFVNEGEEFNPFAEPETEPVYEPVTEPETEAPTTSGMSEWERQTVLNRRMDNWWFPLAEEYFDDITDFASCRGNQESALYAQSNYSCTVYSHGNTQQGSDSLIIRVPDMAEVYAPTDGTLYRSDMADSERGYVAVIETPAVNGYAYYIILGNISGNAPLSSGTNVYGGNVVAYTRSGDFCFSAVMDKAGRGEQIAKDASWELSSIAGFGWLTDDFGTGLICVNPSVWTQTSYYNDITRAVSGPIAYDFVPAMPIPTVPPTEAPTEAPTEIPTVHEHVWDARSILVEATHTSEGQMQLICTACGTSTTETIPALTDHTFNQTVAADAYLAAPASCTSPALYFYSCICGQAGYETFPVGDAGTHTWGEPVITVQPTHTANGEQTRTCTTCGATETEVIPASAEHVYDQEVADAVFLAAPATCASPALYYKSCVCGQIGTETFAYGEASGHVFADTWTSNEEFHWHAAICEHTGETSGMEAHSWDAGNVTVQPTHTSQGEALYTCTVCGAQTKQVLEPVADHTFDQSVVSENYLVSGATCTEAAVYYKSCICGQAGSETFTSGAPLGHSFADTWSTSDTHHWHAATCGHDSEVTGFGEHSWDAGKETVKPGHNVNGETVFTCTVCGHEKKEVTPGESHICDQTVVDAKFLKTAATCTEPAVYYKSCVCGEIGTETFTDGAAKGHSFAEGWSSNDLQHWHAATCEHTNEKSRVADHIWDFGKITTQPTATAKGIKTYTCSVCQATKTEEIEPSEHKHTYANVWTTNETYHWHAATCGHNSEVGDLNVHIWNGGVITTQATHTADGEKLYTCLTCGATKREVIKAEHIFNQQVPSAAFLKSYATCTSPAAYYYSCSCGAKGTESFYFGNSLGHTVSGTWSKDATFHWSTCAVCGARGDMTAHMFSSYSNACSICGYVKGGSSNSSPITPTQSNTDSNHKHTSHLTRVPGRVPTCTQPGNSDYYTCSCGMWFSDVTANIIITDHSSVVKPATGHVDVDKNGRCDVCKAAMEVATVTYQMTEGSSATWINTSAQGLVFRSNAEYTSFDHVEVDGKTISSLNYDVSSGSTIVELSAKYLKTLETGKHTMSIVAKDGKATTDFTIKKGSSTNAAGESKGSSVWVVILVMIILLLLAAAGAVAYLLYFKKPSKGGKFSK